MHHNPGFLLLCGAVLTSFGCTNSHGLRSLNAQLADSEDFQSPATDDADFDAVGDFKAADRTSPSGAIEEPPYPSAKGVVDIALESDVSDQVPRPIYRTRLEADDSPLTRRLWSEYVGLTLDQAKALAKEQNRRLRTCWVDGKGGILTADFCHGRVTANIENGVVQSISVEEMKRVRVDGMNQITPSKPAEN